MNETIKQMSLEGWRAYWKPGCSPTKRGECFLESKLIMVYDLEEKKAKETLLHEALEITIRGVVTPYRTLLNSFIDWADKIAYNEKEKAIDSLLPLFMRGENDSITDSITKGEE